MEPRWKLYRFWRAGAVLSLAAAITTAGHARAATAGGQELQILGRFEVAEAKHAVPTDIRWASDDSVYLSRSRGGVKEVALGEPLKEVRTLVPDVMTLQGPRFYFNLAVSPRFLAVGADAWRLAWRPTALQNSGAVGFYIQPVNAPTDIDLAGNQIVLLGEGRAEKTRDTVGGIAFLGRLSASGLQDYRPVLFDLKGAGTPTFFKCLSHKLGAVRFLPDGTFAVVPGFQPGAHLFDGTGRLIQTWTHRETGLSNQCSDLTQEESDLLLAQKIPETTAWLNRERILDDILPLAEGPGLLVRKVGPDGRTSWDLRILRRGGEARVYRIPFTGGPEDRLSGDVRGGRIVLLRSTWQYFADEPRGGEIILLAAPTGPGPRS